LSEDSSSDSLFLFHLCKEKDLSKELSIALVGASGAAGAEILRVLEERRFPVKSLRLLAPEGSAGEFVEFCGEDLLVEKLSDDAFRGVDVAFFFAAAELSREFCPAAVAAGAVCIDGSGAWSLDPAVPLVVPEVNPDTLAGYRAKGIVACPHAATALLATALKPLHDYARIRRVVVSTYQAVSASGQEGIDELRVQTGELLNGRPAESKVYPHQIAFNCLPHIGAFLESGYSREEQSLADETRKILGDDTLQLTATAVRVPVFYGHSATANLETERPLGVEQARELLRDAPGCQLVDDPAGNHYPTPLSAAGQESTLVGRIRADASVACGLNLWLCADNLRPGATNAVQIAELLAARHL